MGVRVRVRVGAGVRVGVRLKVKGTGGVIVGARLGQGGWVRLGVPVQSMTRMATRHREWLSWQ